MRSTDKSKVLDGAHLPRRAPKDTSRGHEKGENG